MDNKVASVLTREKDSFIVCRNSQGLEIRATLLRLTRYVVVFEVYNPYSILQLSEVLSDFKIIMSDRPVYRGRAVVSNLVNTGILLVCEATLDDESWQDVDLFSPVNQRNKLQFEFSEFLREWQKIHSIAPGFKVAVADMQTLLMDLRRWLEQVELGIRSEPTGSRQQLEREVIAELQEPILPLVMGWFNQFDQVAETVEEDLRPVHRAFARRLLHPLVLCSPFVYRTYHKPLGYAGDYEMVNMILREPYEGGSLFAKIVNVCFLKNPPAEAHRNRIVFLLQKLLEESRRVMSQGRRARVLNLGCGPAKEIQNFLIQGECTEGAELTLVDFNEETLHHTGCLLEDLKQRHHRDTPINLILKSVDQILKKSVASSPEMQFGRYDFVYCAGLFDYLSDRVCKRLMKFFYDLLAPGGLVVATNVDASKPFRHSMEIILEWHLICRDAPKVLSLAPDGASPDQVCVTADPTGVNVFIEVRKPNHV